MREWIGQTRFVFNAGLRRVLRWFDTPQAALSGSDRFWQHVNAELDALSTLSTELRREHDWMQAGPSTIQQDVVRWQLRPALRNWLDPTRAGRRPRFKRRSPAGSFHLRRVDLERIAAINDRWSTVRIPKIAAAVKFRRHRPLPADLSSGTVSVDSAGRWWLSITSIPEPLPHPDSGRIVGIDLGVANSVTVHDGTDAETRHMPATLTGAEQARLRRLQREAARRRGPRGQRPSHGWTDTQRRIAKLRARQADRRRDWIDKTAAELVAAADVICIEDLRVRNMTRSAAGTTAEPGRNVAAKRGLNRAILDQSWAMLAERIEAKAAQHGVTIVRVNPANTSRTCNACGHADKRSRTDRRFCCVSCGHQADADHNAAANIRRQGMSSLPNGPDQGQEPTQAPAQQLRTAGAIRSETHLREPGPLKEAA